MHRLVVLDICESPVQNVQNTVPFSVDWRGRRYCWLPTPEVDTAI